MPIFHDKDFLNTLLIDNNIPIGDAVKRGKFYQAFFDWDSYAKMYEEGKTIKDICKMTGLSYDAVRVNLKRKLKMLRQFKGSKYSFAYNELFPTPSNIGAYFMGWLYSDGCISKNKITLTLQKRDRNHLEYVVAFISDKPIFEVAKGYTFDFFDVRLNTRLIKEYNLIPRKSYYNFKIPVIKFKKFFTLFITRVV